MTRNLNDYVIEEVNQNAINNNSNQISAPSTPSSVAPSYGNNNLRSNTKTQAISANASQARKLDQQKINKDLNSEKELNDYVLVYTNNKIVSDDRAAGTIQKNNEGKSIRDYLLLFKVYIL